MHDTHPFREIRAQQTETTVIVYQAFSHEIANSAVQFGKFDEHFSRSRMTWIKPSFLWMAYRSGWATKPGQEVVLAIEITRTGFGWALQNSCLSHFEESTFANQDDWQQRLDASSVRIQWDPERNILHEPLKHRAIQIGLSREAVGLYANEWIVSIADTTPLCHEIKTLTSKGNFDEALSRLPIETHYELPTSLSNHIGATV